MALEKKFNERGQMNPNYAATIKQLCEENDRKFFEGKLQEIDEYFKERQKEGWPNIKTGHDLNVECQIAPLVRHCLKYLDGELVLA
jgi:gamma-glutamyltranspeptidase